MHTNGRGWPQGGAANLAPSIFNNDGGAHSYVLHDCILMAVQGGAANSTTSKLQILHLQCLIVLLHSRVSRAVHLRRNDCNDCVCVCVCVLAWSDCIN